MTFKARLAASPLVAILRGLRPDEAEGVADTLVAHGFGILEVPLNSPDPLRSIEIIASRCPEALVGAGTVTDPDDVDRIRERGGALVVMPHSDPLVIRRAKSLGLVCAPGVATPTEGFAALAHGADALKLFPAEAMPPHVLKAWRAVFPRETRFVPVGGITPEKLAGYLAAGAAGFGLGSALYAPGMALAELERNARAFRDALAAARDAPA